jgi:hypothetical protein
VWRSKEVYDFFARVATLAEAQMSVPFEVYDPFLD